MNLAVLTKWVAEVMSPADELALKVLRDMAHSSTGKNVWPWFKKHLHSGMA